MIFGNNETHIGSTVAEAEGYNESYAAGMVQLEAIINEGKMLDNLMRRDIREAGMIRAGEDTTEFINEGLKEMGSSIVAMVRKAWEKIKALFSKFLAKFNGVVMRDTKALFKKYQDQWVSNANKKIKKWKWRKPKSLTEGLNDLDALESRMAKVKDIYGHIDDNGAPKFTDSISDTDKSGMTDGTFLNNLLGDAIQNPNTDKKSFAKDADDYFFDSEETYTDEVVPSNIRSIIQDVLDNNKMVSNVTKDKSKIDKFFSGMLKQAEALSKQGIQDGLKVDKDANKEINSANYKKQAIQHGITASNMFTSAYLKATKFHVAQCRRVFMQVVAGSHVKEETMLDAIGEAAEYEVYSSFEDFAMEA